MLSGMPGRPPCWRIGDVEFRPDTGEIRRLDAPEAEATARLRPQPARLLELLAARSGELVTREEIRDLLWPDTHVDLDQSLSFCVRQIRHALGDSASSPTYVETLPRRGYRLLREAAQVGGDVAEPVRAATPVRGLLFGLAAAAVVVGALLVLWWLGGVSSRPIRLAIMPFELAAPDEPAVAAALAGVSESLMVELARREGFEIVGPRSTAAYSALPFPDLPRLASELEVDYVLNARLLPNEPRPQLIVELIRLSDGSHPWVERFPAPWRWPGVAAVVGSGVAAALDDEPR
jgi:DNA-binding winged helix-turn-helix (wHTH) protein/TolB-like protein